MKDSFGYIVFSITVIGAWLTAIIHDAMHWKETFGWLIADIFVPPLAIIRGLWIFIGGG